MSRGKPVGLEARREELRRAAHHLAQLRLAQRRHIDLLVHPIERLIVLQRPEEIGTHAHQRTQPLVAEPCRDDLREAAALALLGAHVKLLALIDVQKECRRLGLAELLAAPLGRIQQVAQRGLAVAQQPAIHSALPLHPARIGGVELPGPQERLDQRLERLGAGLAA